ncbi:unnamed protein product [Peniophora sp. CBMAI 1063]|nr:unnamed protein product [Peniophora sp. CBMAI 1063]
MATHRGDDLEDDFVLDEIVAYSDEEADSGLGDGEDVGHLLSADEGEAAVTSKAKDEKQLEKKRKRKEKLREKKVKRRKLEDESATSLPIAAQSPAAIAEYFANMQAKVFPKSTALELQDRSIPGKEFDSGHDLMEGIEELGGLGGVHYASCSLATHPIVAKN